MKFVDLNSGSVYNGDIPYIHWFDDKQSTSLIYVKKLCVVDTHEELNVELHSDMFKLLDMSNINSITDTTINEFTYKDLVDLRVKDGKLTTKGYKYSLDVNIVYLHMIYIEGSSEIEGEFLEDLYINDQKFTIGASFHPEYEPHKINLGNFGVEFPEDIHRAIYETNIHEELIDYITLNRKRKELLINYWNIVASKGSYKSLYDSLKWFEYGDLVKLQEIWKSSDERLFQKDIEQTLAESVNSYMSDYAKTTYIGLYAALNQLKVVDGEVQYNKHTDGVLNEEVPELVKTSTLWSAEDLSLKMYLLGNFYETYFMPIHLDLIHSTVEHIVFANTIKILQNGYISRQDYYGGFNSFRCNIKDGSKFYLENIHCQVNKDTKLGIQWNKEITEYNVHPIGVDLVIDTINSNEELKTFMTQYYDGIGQLVDFKCKMLMEDGDFIKRADISINKNNGKYFRSGSFKLLVDQKDNICEPEFKLLFEEEGDYEISLSFISAGNNIYTRTIKLSMLDNSHRTLKVYKILRNEEGKTYDKKPSDYIFSSYKQETDHIHTFTLASDEYNEKGVGFQRILIFDIENGSTTYPSEITNEFDMIRETPKYVYFLSKTFDENKLDLSKVNTSFGLLIRDDYVYVPQNHHLEEIGGNSLEDYQVTEGDTLMVIPDIKYLKEITDSQWIIENVSTKNQFSSPIDIKYINRPYLTDKGRILDKGFYNIKFKYQLGGQLNEISLNSSFQVI